LIGKRLAELRKEAHLSQELLGVRAGIHGMHVNKLENNRVRSPSAATLRALADVLSEALGRQVTVDELLGEPEPNGVAS
jgi:transcriptional regulator with XRE-family HTH domain